MAWPDIVLVSKPHEGDQAMTADDSTDAPVSKGRRRWTREESTALMVAYERAAAEGVGQREFARRTCSAGLRTRTCARRESDLA